MMPAIISPMTWGWRRRAKSKPIARLNARMRPIWTRSNRMGLTDWGIFGGLIGVSGVFGVGRALGVDYGVEVDGAGCIRGSVGALALEIVGLRTGEVEVKF